MPIRRVDARGGEGRGRGGGEGGEGRGLVMLKGRGCPNLKLGEEKVFKENDPEAPPSPGNTQRQRPLVPWACRPGPATLTRRSGPARASAARCGFRVRACAVLTRPLMGKGRWGEPCRPHARVEVWGAQALARAGPGTGGAFRCPCLHRGQVGALCLGRFPVPRASTSALLPWSPLPAVPMASADCATCPASGAVWSRARLPGW